MRTLMVLVVVLVFAQTSLVFAQQDPREYEPVKAHWSQLPAIVSELNSNTQLLRQIYMVARGLPEDSPQFRAKLDELKFRLKLINNLRSNIGELYASMRNVEDDEYARIFNWSEEQRKEVRSWHKKFNRMVRVMTDCEDNPPSVWEIEGFLLQYN